MAKAKTSKTTKTTRKKSALPKQVAQAVGAALDKQAHALTILDLKKAAGFTDYFVICTGNNARQVKAIADHIRDTLADDGVKPAHVEGSDRSEWILLDYFDFIVHIFAPETRTFYDLERLWGSAEIVPHEGLA
jgi:ribosome-associated protein